MNSRLQQLAEAGQSVWLDSIRRSMFSSGELRALIDLGLRGMTSNPTIFEKAIGGGSDYDEQLLALRGIADDPGPVFEALAVRDICSACDEFRALYDQTGGGDGLVSLEVSPLLAHDTAGTVAAVRRLWAAVDRPNVMIKIPGTPEGLPAITKAIDSGININVTLLFSVEQYVAAVNAYLAGIELRARRREPVDRLLSVASLFVSRIDTMVDKLLLAQGEPGQELLGKLGGATIKVVYERFKELFASERFTALQQRGARMQRPLWGSTSTKNPSYPELMYVEGLIGPSTVNTVPCQTLAALMDHGRITPGTVEAELAGAHATLAALARLQISVVEVGRTLQDEGVQAFADSYNAMLTALAAKQQKLASSQGASYVET